uniref:Uncharacterized protein n=1 Tax=Pyramimonas obovata TaxID=1411642 RepID=A0A7S0N5Q8_9CHLO|mmetsp:Transcript_18745/g.41046  ORF Transcript_18745/g.41046 Transcript_18745/m.41046 type:complete len:247 (+) Transcript_18745:57-797(+)|eukprot:CAMPEP_0118934790 /NCGR_PEP_ID=MMETSP1169-20130426/14172_1 /TAXON_ID=36882 /ORGANISM="Pyramimonas obovata, Strain CCMP722" /LENGTH=246 /DNA_ID=CAMNT_0006877727 /DNA_START=51 /DNA_END=791 /DNA_ORIENTATION=+
MASTYATACSCTHASVLKVQAREARCVLPRTARSHAPVRPHNGFTKLRVALRGQALGRRSDFARVKAVEDFDLPMPDLAFDDDEEKDELDNWNLLRIVHSEMPDQEVNEIVWRCLGYVRNEETLKWDPTNCFPKWAEKYPEPPDVIGVTRTYTKEVDGPVLKANQALVRSIPMECKQNLKAVLKPFGFRGFKMEQLTPNITRRCQATNWLLYYRDYLRGKSMEQLIAEREARRAASKVGVTEKPME